MEEKFKLVTDPTLSVDSRGVGITNKSNIKFGLYQNTKITRIFLGLLGIITNAIPRRFATYKLMELITNNRIIVKTISCNWKRILLGFDLPQGRTALLAKAAHVFIGRLWLVTRDKITALNPAKCVLLYKYKSACSNFSTTRTVTCPHHSWYRCKLKFNSTATATSFNHR